MTDPSAPPFGDPGAGGPTARAGPSWPGADPRLMALVDYLVANGDAFTEDALAAQAEAADYPPEIIRAAIAAFHEHRQRPRIQRLKRTAQRTTWVVFGLGYLALLAATLPAVGHMSGFGVITIGGQVVLMTLALAISLATIGGRRRAPGNTKVALASLLAVPLVIFLAFPGSCIYLMYSTYVVGPAAAPPASEPAPGP